MNTPAVFVVFLLVDLAASGFPSPGILSKVPKFELIPKPGSHSPFKFGAYMAPSGKSLTVI
jgi:hypothetical protein